MSDYTQPLLLPEQKEVDRNPDILGEELEAQKSRCQICNKDLTPII